MSDNTNLRYMIYTLGVVNTLLTAAALVIAAMWAFSNPPWLELLDYRLHKESLFLGFAIGLSITLEVIPDE